MNTSLDGKIKLTKQEWQILDRAPALARRIAAEKPALDVDAKRLTEACKNLGEAVRASEGE